MATANNNRIPLWPITFPPDILPHSMYLFAGNYSTRVEPVTGLCSSVPSCLSETRTAFPAPKEALRRGCVRRLRR